MSLRFDQPVPPGGYAWWYLDAWSDDGRHGLTVIAFIGSVFSPYYARARRRHGGAMTAATEHCAMNVAIYAAQGSGAPRGWTMTERGAGALAQSAQRLRIGPSALHWDGQALTLELRELTVPWPSPVRGQVRLVPQRLFDRAHALDAAGRHHWTPLAPSARIEVSLTQPELHWTGNGYLDHNQGTRPLEQDFVRWDWSRANLSQGRSAVLYDVQRSDGSALALGLVHGPEGVQRFKAPGRTALPRTGWRLPRETRADTGATPRVLQTLEDGPFYARSLLQTQLLGESATAMHESLSLQRWASPAVQWMLPFRMPRRRAWAGV